MLKALSIRNVVLISALELELGAGLSVLTGETGAGKSILLDALGLALGARGDAALVRSGAERASVTATFELPLDHPVFALLAEQDIEVEEPGRLMLRRVQRADGGTRAWVDGQPVPVSLLRQVGQMLVEIHGQHEARALVDSARHLMLLDAFVGLEEQKARIAELWQAWRGAARALKTRREELEQAEREREWLEHVVAELDELSPQPGEEEELASRRAQMMHAEQFADAISTMRAALYEAGSPVAGRISGALRRLERQREQAGGLLDEVCEAFDRALVELAEAERLLDEASAALEFDPAELEKVEERLFALREVARKHRVQVDDLPKLHEELAGKLAALADGGAEIAKLEQAEAEARAAWLKAAQALSEARRKAAGELAERVMAELPPLKLEHARFEVVVDSDEALAGPEGMDRVEFRVSTNPGQPAGPLAKVASGGELSRFMLALKVVLAARASAPVLVFDEIDTGVGGAVAAALGERLKRLADSGLQVLAVTHSPQVAARADAQFRIAKEVREEDGEAATHTVVTPLDAQSRREEIARMLSAHDITEEARAQAARLLEQAGMAKAGG